jgi:hypothetical protein
VSSTSRRVVIAVAAAILTASSLAACASSGTKTVTVTKQAGSAPATESTASEPTPPAREPVNAEGKFRSACDVLLPDSIDGSATFFANAKLENTGNVGIKVRVKAKFDQVSSDDLEMSKVVRLKRGKHRSVKLSMAVTSSQVEQFQSSPDYFDDKACRVKSTIIDTFGKPPFEDS